MFFILLCFLVAIKINSCGRLSLNSYFSFNSSCAFLLLQRPEHPDRLVSACHDTAETTGKPHPPSTLTLSPGLASGSSHHNTSKPFFKFFTVAAGYPHNICDKRIIGTLLSLGISVSFTVSPGKSNGFFHLQPVLTYVLP